MFRLMRLEDRIVLDGAAVLEAEDHLDQDSTHDLYHVNDGDDALLVADASDAPSDGVHVLVISSDVADADDLAAAVKDGVIVVKYDADQTNPDDLAGMIHDALGGQKADSIAFASHNEGADKLRLTAADSMSADNVQDYEAFWKSVGAEIADGGRIDLLACSVYETAQGAAFVSNIEAISGVNVAASSDITGNEAYGGDWILESDNVDVASTYFDADKLDDFDSIMSPPTAVADPVINPVSLQPGTATAGTWFSFQLSTYLGSSQPFTDADGNLYTGDKNADWTAWWYDDPSDTNHEDGGVLPHPTGSITSWMAFRPATLSFYGMAPADAAGKTYTIAVKAVDDAEESGIAKFQINFGGGVIPTTGSEVNLSMNPVSFSEVSGTSVVTANLSKALTTPVTVDFSFAGSAVKDTDYTASATSVTFNAGETAKTITLTGKDDTLQEGAESVQVNIASITGSATKGATSQANGSVLDNDVAGDVVTLFKSQESFTEDRTSFVEVYPVIGTPAANEMTVGMTFGGKAVGSQVSGEGDYYFSGKTSIIKAGATRGSSVIFLGNSDNVYEQNEDVTVAISSITGGTSSQTPLALTLIDSTGMPTVTLNAITPVTINESASAQLTAKLDHPAEVDVTVGFTASGDASLGSDYTVDPLVIKAGTTTATAAIKALTDGAYEPNETFLLTATDTTITNGKAANGTQMAGATIINTDAGPQVTIAASSTTIAENGGEVTVTATIDKASFNDVTVGFDYSLGTAKNGFDFGSGPATLTITKGATSASFTLKATSDAIDEPDETISIDVSAVSGGTEAGNFQRATVTITDDDNPPTANLRLPDAVISEADPEQVTLYADLSNPSSSQIQVGLSFTGKAQSVSDYDAATVITIPAEATTGSITITAKTDAFVEGNETFTIKAVSITGGNATLGTSIEHTATISETESLPKVYLSYDTPTGFTAPKTSLTEDSDGTKFYVNLTKASAYTVTVNLAHTGTAVLDTDYTAEKAQVVFGSGVTRAEVNLSVKSDTLYEGAEPFEVSIKDVSTSYSEIYTGSDKLAMTVADNEQQPGVTLSSNLVTVGEGNTVNFIANLSNAAESDVTVNISFSGTAETDETDYTYGATTAAITIAKGTTSGTLKLTTINDNKYEGDETVAATITDVSANAKNIQGSTPHTITITDAQKLPLVTLSMSPASFAEGSPASVTANLDVPVEATAGVDIPLKFATGGAELVTTAGGDYTAPAKINVPAGLTTASIELTALTDAVFEGNETFSVAIDGATLTSTSAGRLGTPSSHIATITDGTAKPTVKLDAGTVATINENSPGNIATLTAYTDIANGQTDVKVTLAFTGTAQAGVDYFYGSTAEITIPKDATKGELRLVGIPDGYEGEESFTVKISGVNDTAQASFDSASSAAYTIAETATQPKVKMGLTYNPSTAASINEDDTTSTSYATINVDMVNGATQGNDTLVELDLTGTATFKNDYSTPAETKIVTIAAGATRGTLKISPVDDGTGMPDTAETAETETVIAKIKSVTGGALYDATDSVTATIVDEETPPTVSLFFTNNSGGSVLTTGTEGTNVGLYAVADHKYATPLAVYVTYSGTALSSTADPTKVDYDQPTNATYTVNFSTATKVSLIPINIKDQPAGVYEGDETIVISDVDFSVATTKWNQGTFPSTLTISDSGTHPYIILSAAKNPVTEGEATLLEASIGGTYGFDVKIDLAFSGNGQTNAATLVDDYYYSNQGVITIPSGQSKGSVMFYTQPDSLMEGAEVVYVNATGNNGLTSTSNYLITINEGTAGPEVFLTASTTTIAEDAGTFKLTAATNGQTVFADTTITLSYTGPTYNFDFDGPVAITISKGQSSASIDLTGKSDNLFEGDEVLDISIAANGVNPVNAVTDPTSQHVKVTITDQDKPNILLSWANTSIVSETGSVHLVANLYDGGTPGMLNSTGKDVYITIDPSKAVGTNVTASYGTDYTAAGLTAPELYIKIASGATAGSVQLTVTTDSYYEADEFITAAISDVKVGGTAGTTAGFYHWSMTSTPYVASAVINNDDVAPSINLTAAPKDSAGATFINEKDAPTTATLTATLEGGSKTDTDVTVALNFTGNAQSSGVDYDVYGASQTSIVIPAGQTQGTMTIVAKTDLQYEGDETVKVSIASTKTADNLALYSGTYATEATITIKQEPGVAPPVTLKATAGKFSEGGTTTVETITAVLDQTVGVDTKVEFTFGGTASLGTDYTTSGAVVTITAGNSSAFINLYASPDAIYESTETVTVGVKSMTFGTESKGGEAVAVQYVSLEDAQSAPKVSLSPLGPLVEGNASMPLTATLGDANNAPITRQYGDVTVGLKFGGTAQYGVDYTAPTTLTIKAGSGNGSVPLTVLTDSLFEDAETIIVDIDSVTNGTENGTQQQTITVNNTGAAAVTITSDATGNVITEPDPGADKTVVVTVKKDTATTQPVYVKWQTKDGTATSANNDYVTGGGEFYLGIEAGASQTIPLVVKGDDIQEGNEYVQIELTQVKLGSSSGTDMGSGTTYTLTINNDDAIPAVNTSGGLTVDEGGTGTITNAILKSTDTDHTNGADVTYTIVTPFVHGSLYKDNGDGNFNSSTDTLLAYGSKFTQADVDTTKFFYKHDGSESSAYGNQDLMRFEVSDPAGQKAVSGTGNTFTFEVPLNAVDSPPTAPNYVFYAKENTTGLNSVTTSDGGTTAARVVGTDDTNPYNIKYSLVADSGHDGHFDIDALSGVLTVKAGQALDYEGQTSYHFKVLLDTNDNITDGLHQSTTEILVIVGDVSPEGTPTVVNPIANQNPLAVDEFDMYIWSFAENTFSNAATATYTAVSTGQTYLPTWLQFQPGSRTFFYLGEDIPLSGVTSISIDVTATSPDGSATDTFNLPLILGNLDLMNALEFMDADGDEFFVMPTEGEDVEVMEYADNSAENMTLDADLAEVLNLLDAAVMADSDQVEESDMPVVQADERSITARREDVQTV